MKTNDEILLSFAQDMGRFQQTQGNQREEIKRCYEMKAGWQYTGEERSDRKNNDKEIKTINIASKYIDAVAGSDIVNGKRITYVPTTEGFDTEADIMDDMGKYIDHKSGLDSESSISRKDSLTCGIGGYINALDFTKRKAVAGVPKVTRIFPGFLLYDNSVRGSRLNTEGRFSGYADPVDVISLNEYMEEELGEDYAEHHSMSTHSGASAQWFFSYMDSDNQANLDMLFYYYWWDYVPIYDVKNPFVEGTAFFDAISADETGTTFNIIGDMADEINIDWQEGVFSLDKDSYKRLKDAIEALELFTGVTAPPLEYDKRKGQMYYKAEIARGMVIKASRCFTQDGFPLVFITGDFDETEAIYYGLMRPMFDLQRSLNIAYSDLLGYINDATTGGGAYVKGSVDNIKQLEKSKANEKKLTYITEDMDIITKSRADSLQSLSTFIQLTIDLFPKVIGVPGEFMGALSSGAEGSTLYAQIIKQSTLALSTYANSSASALVRQGEINVDFAKMMATANEGMVIEMISPGHNEEAYKRLSQDNLSDEYAIRAVERPMNADERQETANKLHELMPQAQQMGVNLLPLYSKYANLDFEDRKTMEELATPQPPQPDPRNEAMIDSQIAMQNAQAQDLAANAQQKQVDTQIKLDSADLERNKSEVEIIKDVSSAELDKAKVEQIMAEIGGKMMERFDKMEQRLFANF